MELFLDDDPNGDSSRKPEIQASKTVWENVNLAKKRIIERGGNLNQPYVVDCDASKQKSICNYNFSPYLTRSRYKGHWLIHKNRRMSVKEMMRLQGIDPSTFKQVVSDSAMGQQLGNAMSVYVIEQILANALQAANLSLVSQL